MLNVFLSLAAFLVVLGIPIALILWIVRIVRHKEAAPLTADQIRTGLIGAAISVVSTIFLILLTNQLVPDYLGNFALGLTLATLTFGAGLTVRRVSVVGTSLIVSSLALTTYAFGRHGQVFDADLKAVLSLIGLSLVVAMTYWGLHLDRRQAGPLRLTPFRKVLIGVFVTVLALLVTSFVSDLTGGTIGDQTDGIPGAYGANGLIVTLVSGLVWISIGSTARRVPALSIGFAVAGTLAFVSSLTFIVMTIKGFGPVVVTGLILAGLLILAYRLLRPTKDS